MFSYMKRTNEKIKSLNSVKRSKTTKYNLNNMIRSIKKKKDKLKKCRRIWIS